MSRQEKAGYYTIGRTLYTRSSLQLHYFQFTFKATKEAGLSGATSTAYWGYANSFATLLISILAPILGTVADYKGFKNVFHILLWTRYRIYKYVSSRSNLSVVLIARCYMLALIGFAGANIFYDAF